MTVAPWAVAWASAVAVVLVCLLMLLGDETLSEEKF